MKLNKYLLIFFATLTFYIGYQTINQTTVKSENIIPIVAEASNQEKFYNNWTTELEKEFQQRAKYIINFHGNYQQYGNSFGENEKRSYPRAMFGFLAGNRQKAIKFLQVEDEQKNEHQHTAGIDYYFSFTLKGQIRKYFLFGEYLNPEYRQRMYEGAKNWTKNDPLTQPHPLYGFGDGEGVGWSAKTKGRWVDSRNTDNLRAMRETSVYLMAEETGNEATRQIYKQKIQRYVWALYNIGMGEWDSTTYHAHTFAPYLNLYDFAKDEEVKLLAKQALDWMATAAAIKYYRGGWGGAVKRDYGNNNFPFGTDSARAFWLYFGDTPVENPAPELDTLHMITSSYRPPAQVVAMARKQFDNPVEVIASKPLYENWLEGKSDSPGYWETNYITTNYHLASLVSTFPDGDVSPFKLMMKESQTGVDFFVANTGINRFKPSKNRRDQIGQYQNMLIYLHHQPVITNYQPDFFWQLPQNIVKEKEDNIWFFQQQSTWLAMMPINLSDYQKANLEKRKFNRDNPKNKYYDEEIYRAKNIGGEYFGFALIVGDNYQYRDYETFKKKIKHLSVLDLDKLDQGIVSLVSPQGKTLQLEYNHDNLLPTVIRDGNVYNWLENFDLYKSFDNNNIPVSLGWKKGELTVKISQDDLYQTQFLYTLEN